MEGGWRGKGKKKVRGGQGIRGREEMGVLWVIQWCYVEQRGVLAVIEELRKERVERSLCETWIVRKWCTTIFDSMCSTKIVLGNVGTKLDSPHVILVTTTLTPLRSRKELKCVMISTSSLR